MNKFTESISTRIALDDYQKLVRYAHKKGISKSEAIRRVFNKGLEQLNSDTSLKILIEVLMIMRHSIKNDVEYQQILQKVDEFKKLHILD